jgi:hypothetical protein
MTSLQTRGSLDIFPPHDFYRPFTAGGTPEPMVLERGAGRLYIAIVLATDLSASGTMASFQGLGAWWKAISGTIDRPALEVNREQEYKRLNARWIGSMGTTMTAGESEVRAGEIQNFLCDVYSLASLNNTEAATDLIFEYIDDLLSKGMFAVCDEILRNVDVDKLPTSLMRSFLAITGVAKHRLSWRRPLYLKIERRMIRLKGEEKTKRIIGRLA